MGLGRALSTINSWALWKRRLKVFGFTVTASRGDRLLNLFLHRLRLMGKTELSVLEKFVKPGMTVVDAGANQGLYTLVLSRLAGPTGRVFSFEPDPDLFRTLSLNCDQNHADNVERYNCALGAEAGGMNLFRSRVNAGDNRLAKSDREDWFEPVSVKVSTLDSLVQSAPVDFIKIDVQGWEFEVVKGMANLWANNPDLCIYFEFWPFGLRRAASEPLELLEHMEEHSFRLYEPHGDRWTRMSDLTGFCARFKGFQSANLIAVRGAQRNGL